MLEENKQAIRKNPLPVEVVLSEDAQDDDWDNFVENNPQGQYEQTSRWAQLKNIDCWGPLMVLE